MTPEEQKHYNNYFDLFSSEGWKQLLEELKAREQSYDLSHVNNVETLWQFKGELGVIRMLLNFESFIESAYEEVTNNESN
jgi:hypothetical protein